MKRQLFLASCLLLFACSAFSQGKKVVKLKVVPPVEQTVKALVYPNPTDDMVNVPLLSDTGKSTLLIFNSEGKLLDRKTVEEKISLYELSLSGYIPGNYFITVISGEQSVTYTIIKK